MFQHAFAMFAAERRWNLCLEARRAHALSLCLCSCSSSSGCRFQSRRRRGSRRRSPPPPGPSARSARGGGGWGTCAHIPFEIQNTARDAGAITCISSKVSSSLHKLFFFSSRLSPLSRASRAVASPGAASRFGASSASEKAPLAAGWTKQRNEGFHI